MILVSDTDLGLILLGRPNVISCKLELGLTDLTLSGRSECIPIIIIGYYLLGL